MPLTTLLLLHAALLGAHLHQEPAHRAHVAELHTLAMRGEWRAVLTQVGGALWRNAWHAPPPPPPGTPPSGDAELRARQTLGVERGANWTEIKAAYRALVLEHHPDKLRLKLSREPSDAEIVASEKRFNEIQEAHDVLSAIHAAERELAKERTTSRETQTDGADAREAQGGGVGEEAKEEL